MFGGTFGLIETKALSTFFGNLNYAYRDYGFAYCFLNTSVNKGIRKPNHYSKKEIQSILENYTKEWYKYQTSAEKMMQRNILILSFCS